MKPHKLEDQLKENFSNFEPEVDPSLWTKISSQLPAGPAPTQPVTEPSGVLSSISSAGTWIAGTAAVIISGAAIYLTLNTSTGPETLKVPDSKPAVTKEEQIQPAESNQETSSPVKSENIQVQPSDRKTSESSQSLTPENRSSGSDKPTEEEIRLSQNSTESTVTPSAQDMNPVRAPKPEIPATEKPKVDPSHPANESLVPLKIITNTTGGFAPLTVTAMSNQAGKNSEFDFGDGNVSRNESATHTYRNAGIYTITCSADGRMSEQEIEVLDALPTAFSPNGDGTNDVFEINNSSIKEAEINIYNRYGRKVYSGKGDHLSWNGQYDDGRPAETGTYFYDIFATSSRGGVYKQKGTLTLFR